MGVLSELVVADESDAEAIAASDNPTRDWDGISWKTIDAIKLSTLWAILGDSSLGVEEVMGRARQFPRLSRRTEDGPWVMGVPCRLIDLLAGLDGEDEARLVQVAEAWAVTEEFQGWEPSEVREVLRDIVDLADTARLEGKGLLLWMSL
jgi:hypothetical protein